jgi:aryl-alcohol dehydrogenase-like predicted oxidoreductase
VIEALTRLGTSSQVISRIAFGCEQLGGYNWGAVDPREVAIAIELAIAQGVSLFDTADCYGRGDSEHRLGKLLAPHRDRVTIATKFGVRFTDSGSAWYDSSPQWAREALEGSLKRLGVEAVDLLQMHYWDGVTPLNALFDSLEELREQGKIRWYGITNHVEHSVTYSEYPGFVSASLEYSLVNRGRELAARQFAQDGLTFLAYGCLGQGILSGKYREDARFPGDDRRSNPKYRNFHGARLLRNSRIVDIVRAEAGRLGVPPSRLAITWVLRAIQGSVAVVGIKRADQLRDVLGALTLDLPAETISKLDEASADAVPGDSLTEP